VTLYAPLSLGELVDKITILEIKAEHIEDEAKLRNVRHELEVLTDCLSKTLTASEVEALASLKTSLGQINRELWKIEDDIRECERGQNFGADFIALARSVYFCNDKRAAIKKEINVRFGSDLVEEKSYKEYI